MHAQALRCGVHAGPARRTRRAAAQAPCVAAASPEQPEAHASSRRAAVFTPPLAALAAAFSPACAPVQARTNNADSATNNGFEYMPALKNADYGKVRLRSVPQRRMVTQP
jgi:hypothetical protein